MEKLNIQEYPEFTEELRKLATTDKAHADIFNELFEKLLNNDVYLNKIADTVIKKSSIIHSTEESNSEMVPGADVTANLQAQIKSQDSKFVTSDMPIVILSSIEEIDEYFEQLHLQGKNDQWYRAYVGFGVKYPGFGGGKWYVEGMKNWNDYGWQKITSYNFEHGVNIYYRSMIKGTWMAWKSYSEDVTNVVRLTGGTEILTNADLNNFTTIGNYYCRLDDIAKTILNRPGNIQHAFTLKIEHGQGTAYPCQTLRIFTTGATYYRYHSGTWQGWVKLTV